MLQPNLNFNYQYERNLKCDLFLDALIKIKNLSLRLLNPPLFLPSPKNSPIFKPAPPYVFFYVTPRAKFFMSPPFFPNSLCHPSLCHPSKILCHPLYVTPGMTLKIETGGWSEGRHSTRGFYKAVDSLLKLGRSKKSMTLLSKIVFYYIAVGS